jgi:cyclic-di-AMP phosphodiesterase PgpH
VEFRPLFTERLSGFREWLRTHSSRRFFIVLSLVMVVGLTVTLCSSYVPSRYSYRVGDVASEPVSAPRTVTFENTKATQQLRDQAAAQVDPVYRVNPSAPAQSINDARTLFEKVVSAQQGVSAGTLDLAAAQAQVRQVAPAAISEDSILVMLGSSAPVLAQIEQEAASSLRIVYAQTVTAASLSGQKDFLRSLASSVPVSQDAQTALAEVCVAFLRPNSVLDEQATSVRRQEAAAAVAPVAVTVKKGERVVSAGDIISDQVIVTLQKLGLVGARAVWKIWLGIFLVVILEMVIAAMYLYRFGRKIREDNTLVLVMAVLFLLFAVIARLLSIRPLSPYVVPLAALGMLATIIFNARTGHLLVALQALNVGIITGMDLSYALVALLVGALSLYLVSHLTQRSQMVSSGLWVMLTGVVTVFAAELLQDRPIRDALQSSLWGLGNGLLSTLLALTLLVVFETTFNLTTPLRLLELANPAQPLLRRLMQVAPGTYNHSIMMGNLAEAAAEAIGADPLMARVGAYYHDIGKVTRPEYFIENQLHVANPHDRMSPSLSRLAIMAHVRDGESLARSYGLPQPVVDIIKQHHGTSVLSYFYQKAKQSTEADVPEEEYRYEEEKPASREAAIIMLADSVEAAARSMKNLTFKKLQGLIHEIFKQKMEDGQLDRSQLTFGDLQKIGDVFENGLRGMMGQRIEYPWQAEKGRVDARPPHHAVGGGARAVAEPPSQSMAGDLGGQHRGASADLPSAPVATDSTGEEQSWMP